MRTSPVSQREWPSPTIHSTIPEKHFLMLLGLRVAASKNWRNWEVISLWHFFEYSMRKRICARAPNEFWIFFTKFFLTTKVIKARNGPWIFFRVFYYDLGTNPECFPNFEFELSEFPDFGSESFTRISHFMRRFSYQTHYNTKFKSKPLSQIIPGGASLPDAASML